MDTVEIKKNRKKMSWWIWLGVVLVVISLGVWAWLFNKLPPELPWLYSLPWGEQQLISKVWFGIGLGGLLVVLGGCAWLADVLAKEDVRAGALISRGGFVLVVIYLLSFFQVLRLII